MKRVLIIAAHPDDETLGCGGLISKYIRRDVEFSVMFIAEGSSCRYPDPNCEAAKNEIINRTQHARKALRSLGIDRVIFNDMPCGRLDQVPIITINKLIEEEVKNFQPDTIFTHAENDANNDHRIIFGSTVMATRPTGSHLVSKLYSFEVLTSSEWRFETAFAPNYFEKLEKADAEAKEQALMCYQTETAPFPYPRSKEGVRTQLMYRGMQVGCEFAEAFKLVREIK